MVKKAKRVKLPALVKRKWLKNLRSGEFQQGIGYLHNEGRYCCLGVLGAQFHKPKHLDGKVALVYTTLRNVPARVKDALGEPWRNSNDVEDVLIRMNDTQRCSFKRIAAWIEKHL